MKYGKFNEIKLLGVDHVFIPSENYNYIDIEGKKYRLRKRVYDRMKEQLCEDLNKLNAYIGGDRLLKIYKPILKNIEQIRTYELTNLINDLYVNLVEEQGEMSIIDNIKEIVDYEIKDEEDRILMYSSFVLKVSIPIISEFGCHLNINIEETNDYVVKAFKLLLTMCQLNYKLHKVLVKNSDIEDLINTDTVIKIMDNILINIIPKFNIDKNNKRLIKIAYKQNLKYIELCEKLDK